MRKVGGGGRREEHVRGWSAIRPEGRRSGGEPASAHGYSTMERRTGKVLSSQLGASEDASEHSLHGSPTVQHGVSSNFLEKSISVPSSPILFVTNGTSGPSGYQVS